MIISLNQWRNIMKINEEANFPSQFDIGDTVSFVPMFNHQEKYGISDDELEGTVIAVRFSKAKVFYDVVDEYYGKLFDNVDSSKVNPSMWADNVNVKEDDKEDKDAEEVKESKIKRIYEGVVKFNVGDMVYVSPFGPSTYSYSDGHGTMSSDKPFRPRLYNFTEDTQYEILDIDNPNDEDDAYAGFLDDNNEYVQRRVTSISKVPYINGELPKIKQ